MAFEALSPGNGAGLLGTPAARVSNPTCVFPDGRRSVRTDRDGCEKVDGVFYEAEAQIPATGFVEVSGTQLALVAVVVVIVVVAGLKRVWARWFRRAAKC